MTCPVCVELFKFPITLPCGHNVCKPCLLNSKLPSRSGPLNLACPMCRSPCEFSKEEDMKVNQELQNAVDVLKGDLLKRVGCMRCERTEATVDCEECGVKYCSPCSDLVHTGQLKQHKVKYSASAVQGSRRAPNCDVPGHQEYRLDLYCSDCNVLLCVMCAQVLATHKAHNVVPISEAAQVEKVNLNSTIESALKFRQELRDVSHTLDESLAESERCVQEEMSVFDGTISAVIELLNQQRGALLNEAQELQEQEFSKVRRAREQLMVLASKLNESVAICQRAMKLNSSIDILTGRVEMERQLGGLAPIVLPQPCIPHFAVPHHQTLRAAAEDMKVTLENPEALGPFRGPGVPSIVLEAATIFRQRGFKFTKSTYGEAQIFNRGLSAATTSKTWETIMGDVLFSEGLHYFEVKLEKYDVTNGHNVIVGLIFDGPHEMCEVVGEDANSCGFDTGRGTKAVNGDFFQPYAQSCAANDVVGVKIDFQGRTVEFFVNAVSMGVAFTGLSRGAYAAISLINSQKVTLMFPMKVPL